MNRTQLSVPGVLIRRARDGDEERVHRFLDGLSPRTRTLRFFTGLGRPSASLVRMLLTVDERRDVLVALHGPEVVGHAMSYRGEGADVEVAVVVADRWQGRGLGPRLMDALLARAAGRGATTVAMDVLGENRRALRMIRRIWPDARMRVTSGSIAVTAMIHRGAVFAEQGSGSSPLTV